MAALLLQKGEKDEHNFKQKFQLILTAIMIAQLRAMEQGGMT